MTDSETDTHKSEAELRIARVQALSNADLLGVTTYLLAKYPGHVPGDAGRRAELSQPPEQELEGHNG